MACFLDKIWIRFTILFLLILKCYVVIAVCFNIIIEQRGCLIEIRPWPCTCFFIIFIIINHFLLFVFICHLMLPFHLLRHISSYTAQMAFIFKSMSWYVRVTVLFACERVCYWMRRGKRPSLWRSTPFTILLRISVSVLT